MQFNHLLRQGRLLAAGVVVLSLTAGCQTMTPLFSPPEPSVSIHDLEQRLPILRG